MDVMQAAENGDYWATGILKNMAGNAGGQYCLFKKAKEYGDLVLDKVILTLNRI